jgi:hypothetical protein
MLFSMDDIMEEMYEDFPDIDRANIKRICRKGIFSLKKLLTSGRELIADGAEAELKFFIPTTPDSQHSLTQFNIVKDKLDKRDGDRTKN